MKSFEWNDEKNEWLKSNRNVCFEDVIFCLEKGMLLEDKIHPNQAKYPNQRLLTLNIDGYAYLVPYIENEKSIFFKTMIPCRKATKLFLGNSL